MTRALVQALPSYNISICVQLRTTPTDAIDIHVQQFIGVNIVERHTSLRVGLAKPLASTLHVRTVRTLVGKHANWHFHSLDIPVWVSGPLLSPS